MFGIQRRFHSSKTSNIRTSNDYKMRILITGAQGQLGSALQQCLKADTLILMDLPEFDLTASSCENQIVEARPDVVLHAGAYTNVDGAEREPDQARAVNVRGTLAVARAAQRVHARLIYLSTDYVFDGAKVTPYHEEDQANPINMYGRSKREGEMAAVQQCENSLIVRTAWLYGHTGNNFVKTVMRLAGEKPVLEVVADQRGCPTFADDLAHALSDLATSDLRGICHVTNTGDATWHEFAEAIVKLMESSVVVRPISTAQSGRLARRPPYSVLAHTRLSTVRSPLPHWRDALDRFMKHASRPAAAAR
ncbi:MAG: dTDP-4-dehydrorhamnose reductase [Nitrospira sp. CR1.3]|nr:dTDP-4-dehydrorhamnose reductase [Nitrospira sp. CR1.3]